MMKKFLALILSCCIVFSLTACSEKPCTHDYTSSTTKEATCAETGTKVLTCKLCGDSYNETIPKSENHNYSSSITENATCGEAGTKTFTCITCGNSYEEDIAPTGNHSFEISITKEPTCKETGIETSTCRICGNSYNRDIPKTDDHNYESTVLKEATSTSAGEKKFTCTICGDSYVDSFYLSSVICVGPSFASVSIKNGLNEYAGTLRCEFVSVTINQNNEITHISVKFTSESTVKYYNKKQYFGLEIKEMDTGNYVRGMPINTPDISYGETKTINGALKNPIALSEGTTYEISIYKESNP